MEQALFTPTMIDSPEQQLAGTPQSHLAAEHIKDEATESTLALIHTLCHRLKVDGINYCHWKSNNALDRSANGKNDLDLLVDRADTQRFTQTLHELGFKQAFAPPVDDMPGVLDYYGHDVASAQLIHVHVHYQLVMGQDMTKNYHLPVEAAYLASAEQGSLFRVPAPEFELIVLVLRLMVKHATWDTILMRLGHLPASEAGELTDLLARTNPQRVEMILRKHLPQIDPALFADCVEVLVANRQFLRRIRTARKLSKVLSAQTRLTPAADLRLKLWRRGWGIVRRHLLQRKQEAKRRLAVGGTLIAVVGGDGAGKTSTVDHIHTWLAKELQVSQVHLGKPAWSWTTRIVRALLKVVRVLFRAPYIEEAPILYQPDSQPSMLTRYSLALRAVCAARDRYRTYVWARRAANCGDVVICDRFPLPQITMMEGAQVAQLAKDGSLNWILRMAERLELSYLRCIEAPDLLIVLRVDPEIAVVRRSEEESHPVRVRNSEIWETSWAGSGAHLIDAGQPQTAMLSQVRQIIWSTL